MYKMVVVDDERDVRNRIVSLVNKAGSKFEIIAEYENGIDAYDGIISENPNLILTDIKTPYISGIELAKRVREVFPLVKIVIITGYNEFDYAKEAANIGVEAFISKPVTLEDIKAVLEKAQAGLDEEYLTTENLTQLETFYETNLPIIKENDLYRLSNMASVSPAFQHKLKCNDIDLDYNCFITCLFDFDEAGDGNTERHDLAFSSVRMYVGEELSGVYGYQLFNRYEKLCLIIKAQETPGIKDIERRLERVIQRAGRYSNMPLSVGISNVYSAKNFAAMVAEAMSALEYRSIMGGGKVFFYGNAAIPASRLTVDDNMVRELGYMLRFQSLAECLESIDSIRAALETAPESHYYVITGILNALVKACDNLDGLYTRYGSPSSLYRRLLEAKTDDEIFDYLKDLAATVRSLNEDVKVGTVDQNLQKITAYMEAHFCDADISFESLAGEVNFSVSYISALLKKNMNTSFVKMLTGMRMEKAKELLANPSLKIIDVAERLGYSDSYYFSHCFKKYMGVSPKEYRNNEQKA